MFGLVFGIILLGAAVVVSFVTLPRLAKLGAMSGLAIMGLGILLSGAVAYNDAGYCQHTRTIFGTETSTCRTGWYTLGWGRSTAWPHEITIAHTLNATGESSFTAFSGSISEPYRVRLADNWVGDVTQTTRFAIPQDQEQFISMARKFRSPERLINTTLRPAVTASLDSVANMFTMEAYYAGGQRDRFKSEFKDAVEKGRAMVRQVSVSVNSGVEQNPVAANDLESSQDTSEIGDTSSQRLVMEKITDASGNAVRVAHDYAEHGIIVASAILENLDPDDAFEAQIQARKEAASRRIVAREQRLEQEEQRLLAIQSGETRIAERQAESKVLQIQQTTEAETAKMLALIAASQLQEQAEIERQTAAINLEKARIEAEAVQVTADAEAYAKQAILEADGALAAKLEAWVQAQSYWADAAGKINVPTTVFSGSGAGTEGDALGTVEQFMNMMMMKTARDLQVDPTIAAPRVQ